MVLYCTFFTLKYLKTPYPVTVAKTAIAKVDPTAIGAVSSLTVTSLLQLNSGPNSCPLYINGCSCSERKNNFPVMAFGRLSSGSGVKSKTNSEQAYDLPVGVGMSILRWASLKYLPERERERLGVSSNQVGLG